MAKCCCASEAHSLRNPIFEGVERVVILVSVKSATSDTLGDNVPVWIRPESIGETLKEVYTKRFGTSATPMFDKAGCYGRADQPVTVIPYEGIKSAKEFDDFAETPGTLAVLFQGIVVESNEAIGLKSSVLVFDLVNMRNDLKLAANKQLVPPMAVSFEWDHRQSNFIEDYVKRRIR